MNKSNTHLISIIPDAPLWGIGILLLSDSDAFVEPINTSEHQNPHFYKSRCRPADKRTKPDSENPRTTKPAVAKQAKEANRTAKTQETQNPLSPSRQKNQTTQRAPQNYTRRNKLEKTKIYINDKPH
ncbi:MAG: hypothetical protein IKO41_21035 [Lachnospiraceae bacterium]|nr:hypothetical protein [Lachnospiraceae bacterium]